MSAQASMLAQIVGRFKLRSHDQPPLGV